MMRPRARAAASIVLGVAIMVSPFVVPDAHAQDTLIGYLGLADSDGVSQTGGEPTSQGYPQAQSKTAHTFSSIDTGPNGLALASTQWPGELVGNAGSLAQVFGAPEEAGAANYPVRAEASTAGPSEAASEPGMRAKVEGTLAEATATSEGFDGAGSEFLTFGDVQTVSRSEVIEGEVVVTATATVTDIEIGGIITIDSVQTTAIARSDGTDGSNSGGATVSGLEIAGQPARVDEDGVHAGESSSDNPADAVAQAVIDQVLSNFADAFVVEMYMSSPSIRDEGAIQEYRSGALVVTMQVGDPQTGQGGDGVMAIGGSNAYVQAATGTPFSTPTTLVVPPVTSPPTDTTPSFEPVPDTSGGADLGSTETPTTTEAPAEVAAPILQTVPIVDRFGGLGFAMPFLVLLGGLLAGRGLHRFHAAVVRPGAAGGCLIDGEP
jgi:hypothetical protein